MANRKPNGQILVEALVVLLLLALCFSTVLQGLQSYQKKNRSLSLSKDKYEIRFSQKNSK